MDANEKDFTTDSSRLRRTAPSHGTPRVDLTSNNEIGFNPVGCWMLDVGC